jgi:hypothetical protein
MNPSLSYVFDGEAGLASGESLARLGELREPGLPVRRWVGLRQTRELSHRADLVGYDHFFALLDHAQQFQQVSLCLLQRRSHAVI